MLRRGERLKRVKELVGVAHVTVQRWVRWYEDPLAPYEALKPTDLLDAGQTFLRSERRVRIHYKPTD